MIRFAAEIWAILALCFVVGGLVGWLLSRGLRPLVWRPKPGGTELREASLLAAPLPAPARPAPPRVRRPAEEAPVVVEAEVLAEEPPPPRPQRMPAKMRPPALAGPRKGRADPLHRIAGLGRRNADRLFGIGVYHFSQIAAWTPQELAWVADYLNAGETPVAEDWIGQAARLAIADGPARGPRPSR